MRRISASALAWSATRSPFSFAKSAKDDLDDDLILKKKPFVGTGKPESGDKASAAPSTRPMTKLRTILARETYEESIKDDLPPKPRPPRGWVLNHKTGTGFFSLTKNVHIEGSSGPELLTVVGQMESKVPDVTYDAATGERTEQQHLVFRMFVQRVYEADAPANHKGGLEFVLTSIDAELVLDALAVHGTEDELKAAMTRRHASSDIQTVTTTTPATRSKHARYRGPYMNELDEDLTDEIFDYLDDRGINNAFAEFMMAQAHFTEQEEYLNWLELVKAFTQPPSAPQHQQ